jgi:iron complex outermembrane recepter protein
VQITRRDGDGSSFAVRGISQNRLEINGRSFIGPSDSGQPALESLNPEILSGMEVIKSPSADMTEGALGAIVNLKTKRPLEFAERTASGRVEGVYSNQADDVGYRSSALFAHLRRVAERRVHGCGHAWLPVRHRGLDAHQCHRRHG